MPKKSNLRFEFQQDKFPGRAYEDNEEYLKLLKEYQEYYSPKKNDN